MSLIRRVVLVSAVALGMFGLAACDPAAVAAFVVNHGGNAVDVAPGDGICAASNGACTLRAAIQEGNAFSTPGVVEITFAPAVSQVDLSGAIGEDAAASGDLDLTRPFRVVGEGTTKVQLSGGDRVFDVHPGGSLVVRDVWLDGGAIGGVDRGGIVRVQGGSELRVESVLMDEAVAMVDGGAIASDGPVTVSKSTITQVEAQGGVGGAIVAKRITITGSTIYQTRSAAGSAIVTTDPAGSSTIVSSFVAGNDDFGSPSSSTIVNAGPLILQDATIAQNVAPNGALDGPGPITAGNTVVAGNGLDCSSAVTSSGFNLESGTSCGFTGGGDLQNGAFELVSLAAFENILYFLAEPGPAIDGGGNCLALDIIGKARPIDGNANGTAECDRGAHEHDAVPLQLLVDSGVDAVDLVPGDGECVTSIGSCSLRAAIQETNARNTADFIGLDPAVPSLLTRAGASENSGSTGDLDIIGDLTIYSTGADLAVVDANDIDRVFEVRTGTVVFERLGITDGTEDQGVGGAGIRTRPGTTFTLRESRVNANVIVGAGGGGGLRVDGVATIERSTFQANKGDVRGGGIVFSGSGSVINSTIGGNSADFGSGISALAGSVVSIVDSTISVNKSGVGIERAGSVSVRNSIIAIHTTGGDCSAALTTLGNNLATDSSCGLIGSGDAQSIDPLLGNLQNNGGLTNTRLPGVGSPAIGTGVCVSPTDQRGVARPQGGTCDKGAVEQ